METRVTSSPDAIPDIEAHSRATRASFPEVVRALSGLLGAKLCAYIGSVKETRAVNQWADGSREPSADVQRRLRIALQAATSIVTAESSAVAQAWFQGLNPQLDDRSPARLLRESDIDEVGPEMMTAVREFLSGTGTPFEAPTTVRASAALPSADSNVPRGHLPHLDGTAIEAWASRRDAQHTLPRLVRRLVSATGVRLSTCSFRGGEGVQIPGWDGVVVAGDATMFVPEGASAWELGTGQNPKRKADADYAKRTEDTRGLAPHETTFVFVTARRWTEKDVWALQRRAEGTWRDVRAYDADDLEAWLELAPAAACWMSMELGYSAGGAVDLETLWREWADVTDPPIPPALVTAGRDRIVQSIQQWVASDDPYISFKTDSREESAVLFAASLEGLDELAHGQIRARTLVVRNAASWRELAASQQDLILIPLFGDEERARPPRSGHRVAVPLGNADSVSGAAPLAERISTDRATDVLRELGHPHDKAVELAMLARRSLGSLRRRLATHPEVRQPMWARPEHGRDLLPLLMAGAWDESVAGDREILGELGGATYDDVRGHLTRWVNEEDPPLRHVGNTWFVVSKEDGWTQIARYATADDWERFVAAAERVLGGADPVWDNPPEDRWFASAAEQPRYSKRLRHSFAETLALLGADGDAIAVGAMASPREPSERASALVLAAARHDWRVWASLGSLLPLLAEAHPDQFLNAVDAGLVEPEPTLLPLFEGDNGGLTSTPGHIGLLWALESVAWSPLLLPRASLALGRLATLDPGGRSLNRPVNSLGEIFRPWLPQTSADLDQRLVALDRLSEHHADTAWTVMVRMLPTPHAIGHPTHRPRWRDWAREPYRRVTLSEYTRAVSAVLTRLLLLVGERAERWRDLIEATGGLPPDLRALVVRRLSELSDITPGTRATIWTALRELVARHRSHPDAQWAMPAQEIEGLATLLDRFEPEDLYDRFGWLFADAPPPIADVGGWRERQDTLLRARMAAATRVHEEAGIPGLIRLARSAERPGMLGDAIGRSGVGFAQENELLHDHLAAADPALASFARGFASARCAAEGRSWAEEKLRGVASTWMPEQKAELLLAMPCEPATWDLVEACGTTVETRYWRAAYPWARESVGFERAIESLLRYDRPFLAADLVGMDLRSGPADPPDDLCARVLEQCLAADGEHDGPGAGFRSDVASILDALVAAEFDPARVARIEWGFLRLMRLKRAPRTLHAELSCSPTFFVEVVAAAYRADGEDEPREGVSDDRAEEARTAYGLLQSWRAIPGSPPGKAIDPVGLHEWVRETRALLAASDRATVGDLAIGETLSGSPDGGDGLWPAEPIRDVIELVQSEELEQGIATGVANARGVVTRDLREGGRQEWELHARYEQLAEGVNDRWPRTAAMLRRIAQRYRWGAEEEDKRAALSEELGP